jgi:transposase-like protein
MEAYLDQIKPQVSDTWRADEMYLKIKGNPKYLYALLDDETRYWIAKNVAGDKFSREAPEYASELFRQGKEVAGKKPLTLITDGLHAYELAYRREFYAHQKPVTKHVEHVTWRGERGNEKMESFNENTARSREKTMRSLKREDTPILNGMQIYHNYVRPHEALQGKTPAEVAGIRIEGTNKWLTIIQNARKSRLD